MKPGRLYAACLTLLLLLPAAASARRVEPDPQVNPPPGEAPASQYRERLNELDRRVQELGAKIHESQRRIQSLGYTVLDRLPGGARAKIVHRNEMGRDYSPVKLTYLVDGTEVYSRADERGLLGPGEELTIFDGPLTPQNHTLSVVVSYRGANPLFRYVEGYRFQLRAAHTFPVADRRSTQVKVVGYEQGNGLTTDMENRPALDFRVTLPEWRPTAR